MSNVVIWNVAVNELESIGIHDLIVVVVPLGIHPHGSNRRVRKLKFQFRDSLEYQCVCNMYILKRSGNFERAPANKFQGRDFQHCI